MSVDKFLKVLEHYGVQVTDSGDTYRCRCPIHDGVNYTQFALHKDNALYYCHSCQSGGDIINFIEEMEGLGFKDAVSFLEKDLQIKDNELVGNKSYIAKELDAYIKLMSSVFFVPEEYIPLDMKLYPVNKFRGIGEETLRLAKVSFAERYPMINKDGKRVELKNRLIFPLYHEGVLIGHSIRRTKSTDNPKWLHVPRGVKVAKTLYNYDNIVPYKEVIIVEGISDALNLIDKGYKNVVCVFGSRLSDEQLSLLLRITDKVAIMFDGDKPGRDGAKSAYERLNKTTNTRVINLPDGADPGELTKDELDLFLEV